jgi:hypothetical protein
MHSHGKYFYIPAAFLKEVVGYVNTFVLGININPCPESSLAGITSLSLPPTTNSIGAAPHSLNGSC